jgi:hypothetical protein
VVSESAAIGFPDHGQVSFTASSMFSGVSAIPFLALVGPGLDPGINPTIS